MPPENNSTSQPRPWGVWTTLKLKLLQRYLQEFTIASQRAVNKLYLDLFAGTANNVSQSYPHVPISSSAELALLTTPRFTQLVFFELANPAKQLESNLQRRHRQHSGRYSVTPGDCNTTLAAALHGLPAGFRHGPVFAFVDPYAMHVRWPTFQALSRYKAQGRSRVEQWILFPHSVIPRLVGVDLSQKRMNNLSESVTEWYGTPSWKAIFVKAARRAITPQEASALYLLLFRYRLEYVLGYKYTIGINVPNSNQYDIYMMVFATDHAVGDKIMNRLYGMFSEEIVAFFCEQEQASKGTSENGHRPLHLPGVDPNDYWAYEPYIQKSVAKGLKNMPPWLQRAVRTPALADREFAGFFKERSLKSSTEIPCEQKILF